MAQKKQGKQKGLILLFFFKGHRKLWLKTLAALIDQEVQMSVSVLVTLHTFIKNSRNMIKTAVTPLKIMTKGTVLACSQYDVSQQWSSSDPTSSPPWSPKSRYRPNLSPSLDKKI